MADLVDLSGESGDAGQADTRTEPVRALPEWTHFIVERILVPVLTVEIVKNNLEDLLVQAKAVLPWDFPEMIAHPIIEFILEVGFSSLFATVAIFGGATVLRVAAVMLVAVLLLRLDGFRGGMSGPWRYALVFGSSLGLGCGSIVEVACRFFRADVQRRAAMDEDWAAVDNDRYNPFRGFNIDLEPVTNEIFLGFLLFLLTSVGFGIIGVFAHTEGLWIPLAFGVVSPFVCMLLIMGGYVWTFLEPVWERSPLRQRQSLPVQLAAPRVGGTVISGFTLDELIVERQRTWRLFVVLITTTTIVVISALLLMRLFLM